MIVTSEQAAAASEAELREAIDLLTRHLTERVTAAWDAFDPGPSPAGRETVEERSAPGGCYRLERGKCGKCARCEDGPVHGPYWYWYGRNGGRVVSRYIGKQFRTIDEMDGAARQPMVGDRVQLRYQDGSGCVGTWEETGDGEVLRLDDGSLHRHVTGHVERLVLGRGQREVVRGL